MKIINKDLTLELIDDNGKTIRQIAHFGAWKSLIKFEEFEVESEAEFELLLSTLTTKENLLTELIYNVEQWSKDRDLHNKDPKVQSLKLLEEFGELAAGILKDNDNKIIDSLGDMIVVLIILHQQLKLSFEDTLSYAWAEIKDRKGKTIDGVFVKEEDLK